MNEPPASAPPDPEVLARDAETPAANPWPGLASYTEDQRHLFFGRATEINEVVRLVGRETLTVLFGRSGLGKSSLLRAGVMPRLREADYFPMTLRLDFSGRGPHPVEQIKALVLAAARGGGVELEGVPASTAGLTLWEFFHAVEFWGPRNDPVTPVVALDQFEEVFTLGRNLPEVAEFVEQLADLLENRVPQALKERLAAAGGRLPYDAARANYKVVISLREDFVARLDSLRPVLPAIMRNRFALAPLAGECACSVVLGAGRTWVSGDDARGIVAAVVGGSRTGADGEAPPVYRADAEVEPAYLSVMCHELFRRMQALGRNGITRDLIAAERGGILEGLYTRSFEGLDGRVRLFVEDRLLTPSGFRGTLPLADAAQEGIAEADLNTLVDRRLLRFEDRLGTVHLELSHDLLTRIVLKRRESRRAEEALQLEKERARRLRVEQLAQRRRSRITTAVAVVLAALLLGTVWGGYYFFLQEHRAAYRTMRDRNGFPEGVGPLTEAEARQLPMHYVTVYRGIAWNGGRPRWKPVFRFVAVNARGHLTTSHGVGTYLWEGFDETEATEQNEERSRTLGLHDVCQWEYVSDDQGGIAYARGLDRHGRMVWGCAYSPTAAGGAAVRLAHYVGPEGFAQLQHNSAAEYVEVHYSAEGWVERTAFFDARGRPATGPDGAYGVAYRHEADGRVTQKLALGEQGRPMIGSAGNCGLQAVYDAAGEVTEQISVDTDARPCPTAEGWVRCRMEYDALGRLTRSAFFGPHGEPMTRKAGFHAIAFDYDREGNQVRETYQGPDGGPARIAGEIVCVEHRFDDQGREIEQRFLNAARALSPNKQGYCRLTSEYDERDNLLARGFFGGDGQPVLLSGGVASWRSEFDERNKELRRRYFGVHGEPVRHKDGNHGWEKHYDARGNNVKYTYLGLDGKPTFAAGAIAGYDAIFDGRGLETRRTYFGPAGEPVLHESGNHGYESTYDDLGYEKTTTYFGLDGQPLVLPDRGYATREWQHDEHGRATRCDYFDGTTAVNLKQAGEDAGYHGDRSVYDARGLCVEYTTLGFNGEPVVPTGENYATVASRYDARGYEIEKRYLNARGRPVRNEDDVFVVREERNAAGEATGERYFDLDGQPMEDRRGVGSWAEVLDPWGRVVEHAEFGADGKPVASMGHACLKLRAYDGRGYLTETRWCDAARQPVAGESGYAAIRTRYDVFGNALENVYLDADGQPYADAAGVARQTATYDERQHITHTESYGLRGERVRGQEGCWGWDRVYDAPGRLTRLTYLGTDGQPVVAGEGHARHDLTYFPSGRLLGQSYHGAAGEPVLNAHGSTAVADEYSDAGQLVSRTWQGIPGLTAFARDRREFAGRLWVAERYTAGDGQPVNSSAGYATMTIGYNAHGDMLRQEYLDASGKLAYGERGYARAERGGPDDAFTYRDVEGRALPDANRAQVPLLYVDFIRSREAVAARAGLLPGDVVWKLGEFSAPALLAELRSKPRPLADIQKALQEHAEAAQSEPSATARPLTVIRGGQAVELTLPAVPAAGLGASFSTRTIPAPAYDALAARLAGPPGNASSP